MNYAKHRMKELKTAANQMSKLIKETDQGVFAHISTQISAEWKSMTSEQKEPYLKMSLFDNEVPSGLLKEMVPSTEGATATTKPGKTLTNLSPELEAKFEHILEKWKSKVSEGGKPMNPPQSHILYFNVRMREISTTDVKNCNLSFAEKSAIVGKEWREMSEELKTPYR